MKRINNLYDKIISLDNLELADQKARRGKRHQYGVIAHDLNKDKNLSDLHEILKNKSYKTSEYKVFTIHDPKERQIYCLPYFPDRIVHHAIMNIMEPIFVSTLTADTYSCIKGRGIHAAANAVKFALADQNGTTHCLKLDIKKFYPNVDHDVLKHLLRKKIKDKNLLILLDEIIDSADGVPIGNYLSQYFANFYLAYFDHWIKEVKKVNYYFRYADDLVILSDNKPFLHGLLADIKQYLSIELKLTVKENYQVFPVAERGIDFVGYKFFHTHVLLRKRIKKNFAKMLKNNPNSASIASYNGWLVHANCKNLTEKLLMTHFKELGIKPPAQEFPGEKIFIDRIINREITVCKFKIVPSKYQGDCLYLGIILDQKEHIVFTSSKPLIEMVKEVPENKFPFQTTIVRENQRLEFS